MRGIKFTESIIINCNQTKVFNYTQDYNTRLNWDTFLIKAVLIEGATEATKGAKAYCVAKNGLPMVTEYITFNPPKNTAIQMIEGPYMFKTFLGSWIFKELGQQQTEVVFLYSFTLNFPYSLVSLFIKLVLQRNVRQRLRDLKNNLEL